MDDRKLEILDATRRLINEKGLDNTSTNDIVREVGISRGTLYHHFESKEAILDALVDRVSEGLYARAREVAGDRSVPVVERLMGTIMSLSLGSGPDQPILDHLNSPANLVLHQKVQRDMLTILPGILAGIIEDGISEGIFDTAYPYECMEVLVAYVTTVLDEDLEGEEEEDKLRKLRALMVNMERMVGAEEGALDIILGATAGNE